MDEQTAKMVIAIGAAISIVAWLAALQLYRKMAEAPSVEVFEAPIAGKSPADAIKSIVEYSGRLAGPVRLARPATDVLELTQWDCATRITAHRQGGQTKVIAEVDDSTLRRKMQRILAALVVVVIPVTIAGVCAALWYFAAPSAMPGTRWQVVQVLQISHALWPPFLVYTLWKRQRSMARDAASNLLVLASS